MPGHPIFTASVLILALGACGDDSGAAADSGSRHDATALDAQPSDTGSSDSALDIANLDAPTDTVGLDAVGADAGADAAVEPTDGLWLSETELMALPMSGDGWDAVRNAAGGDWGSASVSDQDNNHDALTFAGALAAARTGDTDLRDRVVTAIESAIGTETGSRTLALGRQLLAYVLAADLIGYRTEEFVNWLSAIRTQTFDGRAGIDSLYRSATEDPSNWGCHARASMIAIALYLGDDAQVAELAEAFHDYTGRSGARFTFREDWWQADPENPAGINPVGAMLEGRSVDGVIPDDQRRGGMFEWPPPQENYVWESLQGTTAAAELLRRAGHDAWEWEGQAIRRAVQWLHDHPDFPATGDDSWVPWLVNRRYGSSFPTASTPPRGKSIGWTEWTHGSAL